MHGEHCNTTSTSQPVLLAVAVFFTTAAVEKPPLQIVLAAAACRVIRLLSAQSSDVESQRILAQLTGPSLLTFTSPIVQS